MANARTAKPPTTDPARPVRCPSCGADVIFARVPDAKQRVVHREDGGHRLEVAR
jgi:DNA-directed RNA polymerase subunit RPC12/RpoP